MGDGLLEPHRQRHSPASTSRPRLRPRAWRAGRCSASSSASCPARTSRPASPTASAPIAVPWARAPIRAASHSIRTASWSARSRWSATASTASTPNIRTTITASRRRSRSPPQPASSRAESIRANRISVDGTLLRYSDATPADFRSNPAAAPAFNTINNVVGTLTSVRGYYDANGGILPGTAYGSAESGVRPATANEFAIPEAWIVTDGNRQQPLSDPRRHRRCERRARRSAPTRCAPCSRKPSSSSARPARNSATRSTAGRRTRSSWSTPTARYWAWCAARTRWSTRSTRCRKRRARRCSCRAGSPRRTCSPTRTPGVAGYVQAVRTFLNDPSALTGNTAFSAARHRQPLAAVVPGRPARPAAGPALACRSASSTSSRPGCSRG